MKDALLEIGSEELPASFIEPAIEQLKALAEASLQEQNISFHSVSAYGTPRRLAVVINGLADRSPDQKRVIPGPPLSKAKDADGKWTPAATGFANKQGLDPSELIVENERLCAVLHIKGLPAQKVLAALFPSWIQKLQFPKSMQWEPSHFRYPRPLRWIAALYGPQIVPFTLAGVKSGRYTFGLSLVSNKKIPIPHPGKYVMQLKNQCVLVEPKARQDAIRRLAEQAVKRLHAKVVMHDALLAQVANLVEHPVAVLGNFDAAYLDLPSEVLTTCLEHHQKFFPVEGPHPAPSPSGRGDKIGLLPHFIGIRNGMSVHQEIVREGYERVLAARLADARFFFNQDRKTPLAAKVDALKGVMFQEKLGNLFDKKERVKNGVRDLAAQIPGADAWQEKALRAAELCKADLVTDMVREFPELQGVMSRLYAGLDGEDAQTAQALEQQYWPITLTGELPATEAAAAAALADKLDTLAGDFSVGLIPTGSADPYGLRRAAVGVLRILESRRWPVSIEALIENASNAQPTANAETAPKLTQFFKQRLAALLEERGLRPDEIDAVMAGGIGRVHETVERITIFHDMRAKGQFDALAAAYKRASNILRQASPKGFHVPSDIMGTSGVQETVLREDAERTLYGRVKEVERPVLDHFQDGSTRQALEMLSQLREPLDRFFDGVMVMVEDQAVCANRLALLGGIVNLFRKIADFSKLQNA